MSIIRIAWRSIQQRGLASFLTTISMALGVMLVVSVLLIMGVVSESFRNNSSLGYNMIVGAKGGSLQLVLNTVYHLSKPIENLPYTYYLDFLPANQRPDGRDGKFFGSAEFAIPMGMGDYFQGFRVVGTIPAMFDDFEYDAEKGRRYEFAAGRNFQTYSAEYGYFEAILGAKVASSVGLQVGDTFSPTHGSDEGAAHDVFYVVGILKPSGTPNDRAVFVNIEGFLLLEGHAKPLSPNVSGTPLPTSLVPTYQSVGVEAALDQVSKLDEDRRRLLPLDIEEREVTSILIKTVHPAVAMSLENTINEGDKAQAVMPVSEIFGLFRTFVDPVKWVLLAITAMVCFTSGVSILVSIYNSMSDRRHEIAVMRALGAGRRKILLVVLLESLLLALGGGFAGWLAGHLLIGVFASPFIEQRTGVSVGLFDVSPKVRLFEFLGESPIMHWGVPGEFLLIPALVLLAIVVGFLPALTAYRTDVAKALSATP